jgi:hypothetical protein
MAVRNPKKRSKDRDEVFYEAMPYAQPTSYGTWADSADEEEAPDHDFAAIEDDGRSIAIRTLVFVALATVLICLLLLWGVQAAQQVLPSATEAPASI